MPIYEYYCPDNHTVYQFYAKTLAQGQRIPQCPDNPKFRMQKQLSRFAVAKKGGADDAAGAAPAAGAGDPAGEARMEAAMGAMEKEFAHVDENDPRAMARMMRRMSELTGEKIDGEMEEVVRKLEEGADPESFDDLGDDDLGGERPCSMPDPYEDTAGGAVPESVKEAKFRFRTRSEPAKRDPKLYDYE